MKQLILAFLIGIFSFAVKAKEKPVSLAGVWRFEISDTKNKAFDHILPGKIFLPGTMMKQALVLKTLIKLHLKVRIVNSIMPDQLTISAILKCLTPGQETCYTFFGTLSLDYQSVDRR